MEEDEVKIFKPRNKDETCVHWIDCYKNAEWVVEHQYEHGSRFDMFCDYHLKQLFKKKDK